MKVNMKIIANINKMANGIWEIVYLVLRPGILDVFEKQYQTIRI